VVRFSGVFDRDEIAQFIGKGCDVAEGIGDREGLALGIDRDRGDLAQRVRDGREIALSVVAERGGVAQGSMTVEDSARSSKGLGSAFFTKYDCKA
jgi:hypothetical protein